LSVTSLQFFIIDLPGEHFYIFIKGKLRRLFALGDLHNLLQQIERRDFGPTGVRPVATNRCHVVNLQK